ncbi:unnamed protein product, partial [marine sediment metagenome]
FATDLQAALFAAGYETTTVTYDTNSPLDSFVFIVNFIDDDGGVNQPPLVPGTPPSMATVDVVTILDGGEEDTVPADYTGYAFETFADPGTSQHDASIGMTSSGSFVMVWNENARTAGGSASTTNLYFREFRESTDTVGPLVTDFLLPNTDDSTAEVR